MIRLLASLAAFLAAASPTFATSDNIWLNRPAGMVLGLDFSGHRISTPNGQTGTLVADAVVAGGTRYLTLDGTGDVLRFDNMSDGLTAFTFCAWVYPTASGPLHIAGSYNGTNNQYFNVFLNGGYLDGAFGTGSATTGLTGDGTAISTSVWTHIAVRWDGTTITRYVNGVANATTDSFAGPVSTSSIAYFGIGARYSQADSPANFFIGRIGSVQFFRTDIGAARIAQLANQGMARQANGGTP